VASYNLTNYGRRAFSYADRHAWYLLPDKCVEINIYSHLQEHSIDILIRADYAFSALETILSFNRLYSCTF